MSDKSSIQWTSATWNPLTGCEKVSPGCTNCYAETFAERWRGIPGHPYEQGFDLKLWPERLSQPLRWKKPRLVFVNSMSDLFHHDVPDEFIRAVWHVMAAYAKQHTFQVLTKRPERMRRLVPELVRTYGIAPNVWLGVSIESNEYAWRADMLRQTPAAVRFLSCEPLLGPLHWSVFDGIDWAIVGGESGPGHRPMDLDWPRDIFLACRRRNVPFFFKQVGAFRPTDEMIPEDLRIREFPNA